MLNTTASHELDYAAVTLAELFNLRDKISLFGGFSEQQLLTLLPQLKAENLQAGTAVFQQTQLPCNIYIVLSGSVRFEHKREDGSRASMRFQTGDCFGETAVIGIMPHLGSATTETDTRVLVLSRTCFMEIAQTDSFLFGLLMMNIAREVSRRLHAVVATSAPSMEVDIPRP